MYFLWKTTRNSGSDWDLDSILNAATSTISPRSSYQSCALWAFSTESHHVPGVGENANIGEKKIPRKAVWKLMGSNAYLMIICILSSNAPEFCCNFLDPHADCLGCFGSSGCLCLEKFSCWLEKGNGHAIKSIKSKRTIRFRCQSTFKVWIPWWELTYPHPRYVWRWFSFSQGGIC